MRIRDNFSTRSASASPLALGLLLRRWLIASHAIVNVAFLGLAKIEEAASTLVTA